MVVTLATRLTIPPPALLDDASLFLDFDGTLVEIAATPEAVRVDAALPGLIARLATRLRGRLAIVSGRAAAEIAALLGAPAVPIAGSHGMEIVWPDGIRETVARPIGLADALDRAHDFAAAQPGVLVEDKPLGVGVHFRGAPEAEHAALALAEGLAATHGLHLQHGKMLVELRAAGGDKGSAIRRLMREPGMGAGRPVFMGDDVTDEAGFAAAHALGGAGVLVGAERVTAARHRLDDVAAARRWLEAAA